MKTFMGMLEKIPTFLTVGVLVIIFVCLKRQARCARLTLWTIGWTLVFTHFLAQLLKPDHGPVSSLLLAVDAGSLQAAVVAFLVSVSSVAENRAKRTLLLLVLGVPSVAYMVCTSYNVQATWPYILCLAACFSGAVCFSFELSGKLRGKLSARLSLCLAAATLPCSLAAAWAIAATLNGSFQEGTIAFIGIGFGFAGIFICRSHGRLSPAILTIAGGFFSWGAAFPIRLLIDRLTPHLTISAELWNTPKIFVALGMILAVVEDKSESIAGMQHKASQRFGFEALCRHLDGVGRRQQCREGVKSVAVGLDDAGVLCGLVDQGDVCTRDYGAGGVGDETRDLRRRLCVKCG